MAATTKMTAALNQAVDHRWNGFSTLTPNLYLAMGRGRGIRVSSSPRPNETNAANRNNATSRPTTPEFTGEDSCSTVRVIAPRAGRALGSGFCRGAVEEVLQRFDRADDVLFAHRLQDEVEVVAGHDGQGGSVDGETFHGSPAQSSR